MSNVSVVTVDAGGNVPPALRLAEELARRGHAVTVLGHRRQAEAVAASALPFHPLEHLESWSGTGPRSMARAAIEAGRLASDVALEREVGEAVRNADLAIIDCLMPSALRGARVRGVPTAAMFHTYLSFWDGPYRSGPAGLLSRLRGTDPRAEWRRAGARLVVSDLGLDPASNGRTELARTAEWVGPVETGAPRLRAPEPPLVAVSLSTTWFPGQTQAYERVLAVLAALPVRGVVTLGGLHPDRALRVPTNVEVRDRADHGELFRTASLLIGHGGHSTSFRAVAHGLPVLLLPMHPLIDQPAVARSIERAGAGRMLPRFASVDRIATAVTELLADAQVHDAAGRLGERIRSADGASAAADAAERLIGDARPRPATRRP